MANNTNAPPSLFSFNGDCLDQGYVNIRRGKHIQERELKAHCEGLWEVFRPYADFGFIEKFACHLDEHYWEMYLGCTLLEAGLYIHPKTTDHGPDLLVKHEGQNIWIEAIAPTQGDEDNENRVPDLVSAGIFQGETVIAQNVPKEELVLRLTNAIWVKKQKFDKYKKDGIVNPDDACVVAITGAQLGRWGDCAMPLVLSSTYGIGEITVCFPVSGGGEATVGNDFRMFVEKSNGEKIPTTAFLHPMFSNISAVIYDHRGLGAYRGRLGCDFKTIHNKLANAPLPKGLIKRGIEYIPAEDKLDFTDWEKQEHPFRGQHLT